MWRTSWVSHANARTSKRWNSETSPAVHSVWCKFIASIPAEARSNACRSSGGPIAARRSECTSFTPLLVTQRLAAAQRRGSTPRGARGRRTTGRPRRGASAASGDFTSTEHSYSAPELVVDVGEPGDAEGRELLGASWPRSGAAACPGTRRGRARRRPRRRPRATHRSRCRSRPASSAREMPKWCSRARRAGHHGGRK